MGTIRMGDYLCTVLGSDQPSDCTLLKNGCQSVTTTHKVIPQAYDGMPISLKKAVLR